MKDTRKTQKTPKKEKTKKNNLFQSSFIEKDICKKKKKDKNISTPNEKTAKKRNMETYRNNNNKWKIKK